MTGTSPSQSLDDNARTVEGYEQYAAIYTNAVAQKPSGSGAEALRLLADIAGEGGAILELGSGPGWDADYVESLGPRILRTDVAQAFCDIQAERGRKCERLDALIDDFGGPYDGVMALCLVQHFGRDLVDGFLVRVATALRSGGSFLVSIREGSGDVWEKGDSGRDYFTALWSIEAFSKRLAAAGLTVKWCARTDEDEGVWQTLLAQKD